MVLDLSCWEIVTTVSPWKICGAYRFPEQLKLLVVRWALLVYGFYASPAQLRLERALVIGITQHSRLRVEIAA